MNSLNSRSRNGAYALLMGQSFKLLSQVVGMVVLARLLSPEDYGLTAIAFALISVGEIFRDFGLSTAAIQAQSISHEEKSNLFWLNTLIGSFFALLLFFCSPLIADLYNDNRLDLICKVLSSTFLLNGIATQYRAGLNRDLNFKCLAATDSIAATTGTIVGIYSALHNYSYWSIVIQQIFVCTVTLGTLIYFYRWTPSFPYFHVSIKRFTDYGTSLFGMQLIGQISKSMDTFVIGYQFGSQWLGIYNRAQQVVATPLNQINQPTTTLALPILSKLKDNEQEYYKFLEYGQSILLHVVCFLFSILAINADTAITIVLGTKWLSAVPLVQILCIGAIFQVACYPDYWICLSQSFTKERLKFTVYSRPVIILFIILGSYWNIYTVSIAYISGFLFIWIYSYYFLKKLGIKNRDLFKVSLTICFTYISGILISVLLVGFFEFEHILKLLAQNGIFFSFLAVVTLVSQVFRKSLLNLLKLKK